ncbi:hypothetical protein Csa_023105, partial [Cucumis sativus]
ALIHVYDATVAKSLHKHEDRALEISICGSWMQLTSSYLCHQTASYGGWIDIFDLPPILCYEQIVKFIGNHCGGYVGCANQTGRGLNFKGARLKIRPKSYGLIPARLLLPMELAGLKITVRIRGVNVMTTPNTLATAAADTHAVLTHQKSRDSRQFEFSANFPNPVAINIPCEQIPSHSPALPYPNTLVGPTKSSSPSFNQPSLAMVTFQADSSNLREGTKHVATPENQLQTFSDSEADLTALSPKDDFATHSWEDAVFGENPTESNLSITILPPVPTDLHNPI